MKYRQGTRRGSKASDRKRVWTINGDFLGLGQSGVARCARELVRALDLHIANEHPLTIDLDARIVAPCAGAEPLTLTCMRMQVLHEYPVRLPQVWLQAQLPRHVEGGLVSLCNLAPAGIRRQIVCIHDLQTFTVPESYSSAFRIWHRLLLPRLGRRAARIMTVSDVSRQQLAEFGVAPSSRTTVAYNGSDHVDRWRPDRIHRTWSTGRPFILCMSRAEAHKNMELLWRLAEPLDLIGLDLALVGRSPAGLESGILPRNVIALGQLSDDELASVFAQAFCFLLPSRTEGFGLPAVEAMRCGCPAIVSNVPSLREVCGDAALFAAPDNAAEWIAAIRMLLSHPGRRRSLIAAGRAQAARYSWAAAAELYLHEMAAIDRVAAQAS